jgi:spore germination protein YaaH
MDDNKNPDEDNLDLDEYIYSSNRINKVPSKKMKIYKNKTRRKSPFKQLLIASLIVIIFSSIYVAYIIYKPNNHRVDIYNYYSLYNKDETLFVINDNFLSWPNQPIIEDETIYIPIDFIKEHIDEYIFWDASSQKVVITTPNEVIRISVNNLNYSINNRPAKLTTPVIDLNGLAYISDAFISELYHVNMKYSEDSKLIVLEFPNIKQLQADIDTQKLHLRYEPTHKSPIAYSFTPNEQVIIYDEESNFTKVRTIDGLIGYIPTKNIISTKESIIYFEDIEPVPINTPSEKLVLLWDQIFSMSANYADFRREPHDGLNIISPTWLSFNLDTLNGDIDTSLFDNSYINWAHSEGYEVWPLLADFPSASTEINLGHEILTSTEKRENAITQLINAADTYKIDGINIDFELIRKDDAPYFLQFLREMYPILKKKGVKLSVDTYVPKPWTEYYNRTELAKTSDYIVIMAYDEYYAASETSGPVASIGFVEDGILDTLSQLPKEKILLGIPVYCRVWREEIYDGVVSVSSKDYGMQAAYNLFINHNATFSWIPDIGANYAEYSVIEKGKEITYKVWLEDEQSIQKKLDLAIVYDLAGVGIWKRGLEIPSIWNSFSNYSY